METRIMKKIDEFLAEFKHNIKEKTEELGLYNKGVDDELAQLIQYVFDYKRLELKKEDFVKRKRIQSSVETSERCCAKRANGEQCTRRKKQDENYCGTHMKGIVLGFDKDTSVINEDAEPKQLSVNIWAQEIKGIVFYIDTEFNVYKMEDIMSGKNNPEIIAKYSKTADDIYCIPELNV